MAEFRLFPEGTVPECTTAEWYLTRERAPHLEQPYHRDRLLRTEDMVVSLIAECPQIADVVDLGCGDGGLLSLLRSHGIQAWGYDLSPEAVNAARSERGVQAFQLDVVNDDIGWGDLAVATEMLEHLVDPHGFVRKIAANCQAIVASSPFNECPPALAYEFHTWAWDPPGYRVLIEQAGFKVIRHEPVHGFQVISAVREQ